MWRADIWDEDISDEDISTCQSIRHDMESVTKTLNEIEVEARMASVIICDTFDAIESLVSETRNLPKFSRSKV